MWTDNNRNGYFQMGLQSGRYVSIKEEQNEIINGFFIESFRTRPNLHRSHLQSIENRRILKTTYNDRNTDRSIKWNEKW